jgi:methylenetetrahydrofolate reductase (NADPH)
LQRQNRNQLESELLALDRENLHNLLVLTGDYPFYGYLGRAKPVFDLDSVLLLRLITEMEKGVEIPKGAPGGGNRLPPIPFFKGCAVSPFKLTIEELWWQYLKLYRKLKAGARFIITQVGFSPFTLYQLKLILNDGLTKYFSERLNDKSLHKPEEDSQFKKVPILPSILYLQEPLIKALLRGRFRVSSMGGEFGKGLKKLAFLKRWL